MSAIPLQHGIFMAPYHDVDESPTIALRRDLELVAYLDGLGFKERHPQTGRRFNPVRHHNFGSTIPCCFWYLPLRSA